MSEKARADTEGKQKRGQRESPASKRPQTWKPGQSGNPAGRPRVGESWKELIGRLESEPARCPGRGVVTRKELIAERVTRLAEAGVPWAVQFLAERREGKPTQEVQVGRANPLEGVSDEELRAALEMVRAGRAGRALPSPATDHGGD